LIVFDKTNKKLWQATLSYSVTGVPVAGVRKESSYGDARASSAATPFTSLTEAVLTAFDLSTECALAPASVGVWHVFR